MSTVVMTIEGVLGARPRFDVTMQPTATARVFYYAMAASYRIVLATDEGSYDKATHWLQANGFGGYGQVLIGEPEAMDSTANRVAQLRGLRSSRTVVDLVVDTNAEVLSYAASIGITGLLWVPAKRGAERLDMQPAPIRSWGEMAG